MEPLLDIVLNGVHADDIRREIEVGEDISLVRVLCQIQIAHGDVRASCAEHHLTVSEARGAYLSVLQ